MFPNSARDRIVDSIFGVVNIAFGLLVVGRALNSATAMKLSPLPIVGPVVDSLRAALNEAAYDPRGQTA